MIIYMARKSDYRKSHSLLKKQSYSSTMYGASYQDYKELTARPNVKKNFVVWYKK